MRAPSPSPSPVASSPHSEDDKDDDAPSPSPGPSPSYSTHRQDDDGASPRPSTYDDDGALVSPSPTSYVPPHVATTAPHNSDDDAASSTCDDNDDLVRLPLVSPRPRPRPRPHLLFAPSRPCCHTRRPAWHLALTSVSRCRSPTPPSRRCAASSWHARRIADPRPRPYLPPCRLASPPCRLVTLTSPHAARRHVYIIDSEGIPTHNVLVVATDNKFIF